MNSPQRRPLSEATTSSLGEMTGLDPSYWPRRRASPSRWRWEGGRAGEVVHQEGDHSSPSASLGSPRARPVSPLGGNHIDSRTMAGLVCLQVG